jgi:hypothetical protein
MRMSPESSFPVSSSSVASTTAAGTMSHMARGFLSFFTRSSSETAAVAPSPATCFTDSALRSNATHWCPVFCSRRTIFAPILPSPIIPSCIALAPRPSRFSGSAFRFTPALARPPPAVWRAPLLRPCQSAHAARACRVQQAPRSLREPVRP